jgi:uncharacterized membrane-anchored protein
VLAKDQHDQEQRNNLSTLNHVNRCVQQLHEGQAAAVTTGRQVQRQLAEITKILSDASEQQRSECEGQPILTPDERSLPVHLVV